MLAVDHYPDFHPDSAISSRQLFEIHHSKISLARAKKGYDYPIIRLPHTFSALAGLSTRIYQTILTGALAFLVVVSPTSKAVQTNTKTPHQALNPPSSHVDNHLVI